MNTSRANDDKANTPARRGRPVGDREARRRELLDAAVSVIAEDGYAGASLRKVAKKAGCTTGAVTYYFANKEAMVSAVGESLFDQFDSMLELAEQEVEINVIIRQWLNLANSNQTDSWFVLFQLLAHARNEPGFATLFQQRYEKYRSGLATFLKKGQDQGKIRKDIHADLLADQLSAIGDGWIMMLPIEPKRFKSSRVKALIEATVTLVSAP